MHRLIMDTNLNKKVLDLIHSSIISEGGDNIAVPLMLGSFAWVGYFLRNR